jgi:subtilisin family serine protease
VYVQNRKLIGARYFNKGYKSRVTTSLNSTFETPRDNEGHGSHTLSTAGGNMVQSVNVFGQGNGTAKGGSPRARVASYKVCWPPVNGDECFEADILAAFDMAIHDGVDVLSVSLGGSASDLFNDSVAIGSFHAAKKGIVVVCSAGNSGPSEATAENLAPWYITVGASTMDREFSSYVVLGNNLRLKVCLSSRQCNTIMSNFGDIFGFGFSAVSHIWTLLIKIRRSRFLVRILYLKTVKI